MRALLIGKDGNIDEIDVDLKIMFNREREWDCVDLFRGQDPCGTGHDVWVDDWGLCDPHLVTARIGANPRVPLPGIVLGFDGERTVAATIDIETVRSLVSLNDHGASNASEIESRWDWVYEGLRTRPVD
ncbi:MAG: hypothetical protein ABIV36_08490 [Sphingobium limneticum]